MTPQPRGRRRVSTRLGAGLAVLLVLAGCTGSDSPAPTTPSARSSAPQGTRDPATDPSLARFYAQKPVWKSCGGGFECTTISVPLDWADPGGKAIDLALIRRPATGKRIGSLLFNPGGPGVSAVQWARESGGGNFSDAVRKAYDLVTWDPRGVGSSTPIECLSNAALDKALREDGTPDSVVEQQQVRSQSLDFATGCEKHTGALLGHVDTISNARDLDVIRAALGEKATNYLGWSYGTFLGEWYAQLFGWRVGRMVLDGVVDPTLNGEQYGEGQAQGFSLMAKAFVDDCLKQEGCPLRGTRDDAMTQIENLVQQTDATPLTTSGLSRTLTQALMTTGIAQALYIPDFWPQLREALTQAFRGDGTGLLSLADLYNERSKNGTYSQTMQATGPISCLDRPDPRSIDQIAATAASYAKLYRPLGATLAWSALGCALWPIKPVVTPQPITAPLAPQVMVVGTTGDPATPYKWAQSVARQMKSRLVTYDGEGHTAYGRGSSCIDSTVDAYLLAGTVPAADITCR